LPRDPSPSALATLPRTLWALTDGKATAQGMGLYIHLVGEVREVFAPLGIDMNSLSVDLRRLDFPGTSRAVLIVAQWLDKHGFLSQKFDPTLCRMHSEEVTSEEIDQLLSAAAAPDKAKCPAV
jgi:hypothetical protein